MAKKDVWEKRMGIHDREYYRPEGESNLASTIRAWPMSYRLIAVTVATFLIDHIWRDQSTGWFPMLQWGVHSTGETFLGFQLWRLITFQFLHADFNHLFWNMIGLWCFGPLVESELGRRRFLAFYALCGIGGATLYSVLVVAGVLPNGVLLGASSAILGTIVACAIIAPNMQVLVMFLIPMPIRTLAWITLGMSAFILLTGGFNAGGEAAHLGGAATGFMLIKFPQWLGFVDWSMPVRRRGTKWTLKIPSLGDLFAKKNVTTEELDRLLDKVREQGMASLTSREKATLKRASKERRQRRV